VHDASVQRDALGEACGFDRGPCPVDVDLHRVDTDTVDVALPDQLDEVRSVSAAGIEDNVILGQVLLRDLVERVRPGRVQADIEPLVEVPRRRPLDPGEPVNIAGRHKR